MGLLDRLSWYSHCDASLARAHCYDSAHMQRSLCLRAHPGYLEAATTTTDTRCEHCERVAGEHADWHRRHEK